MIILSKNYTVYHLHTHHSNCNGYADSCSSHEEYIALAKQQDMKSIAFSDHGGMFEWFRKKQDCDKAGIKYIHGVELYMCDKLEDNFRGWHIGLYARNYDGVKELNKLTSLATSKGNREDKTDRQFYYNPRISIEQLKNTSDNIIVVSACLASVFWQEAKKVAKLNVDTEIDKIERDLQIKKSNDMINNLLGWMSENNHRVFLEIQYHNHIEQITYNKLLKKYSEKYNIPLIAGTDTHSSSLYKSECRKILQKAKDSFYGDEDEFDLTWKTYDELVDAFKIQNALPIEDYMKAIENTNVLADMVENFELNKDFKYPTLYGDCANQEWKDVILLKLKHKIDNCIIDKSKVNLYKERIAEEYKAMSKQGMASFMLFMSELLTWCKENNIPYNFCRGSVGGSTIAYITDITDVDPIIWNTIFSRFVNADRISLADKRY